MIVGIDVTHVERIRSLMARYPDAERRFFTERERSHCRKHSDPMIHFAGTFAAKEAVIKTLRLGRAVAWARRVEVVRDEAGAPTASVRGGNFPDEIMLSISHDRDVAIAVAIAPRVGDPAPAAAPTARSAARPNPNLARFLGRRLDVDRALTRPNHGLTAFDDAAYGSDFP